MKRININETKTFLLDLTIDNYIKFLFIWLELKDKLLSYKDKEISQKELKQYLKNKSIFILPLYLSDCKTLSDRLVKENLENTKLYQSINGFKILLTIWLEWNDRNNELSDFINAIQMITKQTNELLNQLNEYLTIINDFYPINKN